MFVQLGLEGLSHSKERKKERKKEKRRTTAHGISWRHDGRLAGYEAACDFHALGGAFAIPAGRDRGVEAKDFVDGAVEMVELLQGLGVVDGPDALEFLAYDFGVLGLKG